MKTKTFLLGLLLGGVASGVTTLLNAPRSGKETRQNLQNAKISWQKQFKQVKDEAMTLKSDISSATKESKVAITSFSNDIKESIADWKNDTASNQAKLKIELNSLQHTMEELSQKTTPNQN